MPKWLKAIIDFISLKIIGPFKWDALKLIFTGRVYDLKAEHREYARRLMGAGVYIWVTRRETHLSTYFINFADFALALYRWVLSDFKGPRPKFGFWSHAFINFNSNTIVEAIGKGVTVTLFDNAFNCDAVAALVPKYCSAEEWAEAGRIAAVLSKGKEGTPYDTVFNIKDSSAMSCIELMRYALKGAVKDYDLKFKDFEDMISKSKNVTPDMLFHSKSFSVIWEVRRYHDN